MPGEIGRQIRERLLGLFWLIRSYLYVEWWSRRAPFRRKVSGFASLGLIFATSVFLAEVAATILHGHPVELVAFPKWLKAFVVVLALFLLFHRIRDWRRRRNRPVVLTTIRELLTEASSLQFANGGEEGRQDVLDEFLDKVLIAFQQLFENLNRAVNLNIMEADDDERLRIVYLWPRETEYDPEFSLGLGEGGAGVAFAEDTSVYIPAVRYRHGIKISWQRDPSSLEYALADSVYITTYLEPYKCILSVPIRGTPRPYGVLNLDAEKQNAFGEFDFQIAEVAAGFVAMAIDKARRAAHVPGDQEGGELA